MIKWADNPKRAQLIQLTMIKLKLKYYWPTVMRLYTWQRNIISPGSPGGEIRERPSLEGALR